MNEAQIFCMTARPGAVAAVAVAAAAAHRPNSFSLHFVCFDIFSTRKKINLERERARYLLDNY
jgi:hypothetical protein